MTGTLEPLTPEQVLIALSGVEPVTFNALREKHPEWTPRLPSPQHFDFRGKTLSGFDLRGMDLSAVDLSWANLRDSKLERCDFSFSNLTGADLREASLLGANFFGAKGLFGENRALCSPYKESMNSGVEQAIFRKPGDHVPWSLLRSISTYRVFGASYITMIILVTYAGWVRWINETTADWVQMLPENGGMAQELRQMLLSKTPLLEVAPHFGIQLLMVICLAVGATFYQFFCPDVIKENSESRWTRELNESLVEYRAADGSFPLARTLALFFYGIGGLYTFAYLFTKTISATAYFLRGG